MVGIHLIAFKCNAGKTIDSKRKVMLNGTELNQIVIYDNAHPH